jgi:predicted phage-related endonuclease
MLEKVTITNRRSGPEGHRRDFIGGSDARIIMGQDEKALIRLWQEKRGEVGPEDLSGNLIVQLGLATEDLNRTWYERNTGRAITSVQTRVKHPVIAFMAATLDGVVAGTGAIYEAKFMLLFCSTRSAFLEHERAKTELKGLMPEDAKEAFGHGVRARRSKAGAVSFEAIETDATEAEASDAPVK